MGLEHIFVPNPNFARQKLHIIFHITLECKENMSSRSLIVLPNIF